MDIKMMSRKRKRNSSQRTDVDLEEARAKLQKEGNIYFLTPEFFWNKDASKYMLRGFKKKKKS